MKFLAEQTKEAIRRASLGGLSSRAVGKLFGVDQKTVVRMNQRFEATGSAKTLLCSGRLRKSVEKNDRALVRIVKKGPLKTATDVTKHANERLGLGISTRTARRILKKADLPASRPSKKPWISKKNIKERLYACSLCCCYCFEGLRH